jgi:hypothetical protein
MRPLCCFVDRLHRLRGAPPRESRKAMYACEPGKLN